jgi:RHS repeat-associated protein
LWIDVRVAPVSDVWQDQYVYGPGANEVLATIGQESYDVYYLLHDGLGSVVAVTDDVHDCAVPQYKYDVYGQCQTSGTSVIDNAFRFTGQWYDTETGLYFCHARHYNPTMGRFLQTDPIGYADGMVLMGSVPVCEEGREPHSRHKPVLHVL